jgi:AraC-like DNA-binding protein
LLAQGGTDLEHGGGGPYHFYGPGETRLPAMSQVLFSSDELPARLGDAARFARWRDFMVSVHGSLDMSCLPDQPFSQRLDAAQFGSVAVLEFRGTTDRFTRTSRTVAASTSRGYFFTLNRGRALMALSQVGRESVLDAGGAALGNGAEAGDVCANGGNAYAMVVVPAERLEELVAGAEDMVARPIDPATPAMRHLRRYVEMLSREDEDDPALLAHIGTALTDLIGLALGAGREAAELARMRGMRASQLALVLAEIRAGFRDPAFSPGVVASKVMLSPRYIRDLLHDTGTGFTERVMELRLQRARAMLAHRECDRLKVIDIALDCGFNEVSYFNRSFRRRFGASPTQYRGGNGDAS